MAGASDSESDTNSPKCIVDGCRRYEVVIIVFKL